VKFKQKLSASILAHYRNGIGIVWAMQHAECFLTKKRANTSLKMFLCAAESKNKIK